MGEKANKIPVHEYVPMDDSTHFQPLFKGRVIMNNSTSVQAENVCTPRVCTSVTREVTVGVAISKAYAVSSVRNHGLMGTSQTRQTAALMMAVK